MTQTNETTQKILAQLYKDDVYAWRQNTGGIFDRKRGIFRTSAKKGVSDIIGCWLRPGQWGRLVAVEVKTGKDRLSPEQKGFLKCIEHYGGVALVARDYEDFLKQWKPFTL